MVKKPTYEELEQRIKELEDESAKRKQADGNLIEKLSFLQTLIDTIPNPLFYKSVKGEYLGVNRAFEEFYGKTREEIIGQTVYDMGPKYIADKYYGKDRELFQYPGKQTYEWKVINGAGETRDVILNKAGYTDQGGTVIGLVGVISDITERKRTEEVLRESAERFRTAFNNAATGIALMANDGYFMKVNQTLCRILGYSEEELMGKTWVEITEPSDLPGCYDWLKRVKAGEQSTHEKRFIHKLGHPVWIEMSSSLVRDSQGRTRYYISLFQDIMFRKRAEEALRESEEKYRSIMEAMDDAVYICSRGFRVEYMNPAMIKRTGLDFTGDFCYKAMYNRDTKCPWCIYDKVLQGEHIKYKLASPKDNCNYHVSSSPIFHTDGSISKLTISRDLTEIKKHDGHIAVESQLGIGTKCYVYLPASDKAIPEKEEVKMIKGHGRILVMDDEASLRKIVGRMLKHLGYESEFAMDGAEAIRMYKKAQESEKPYDAVILDLTVPGGMGGKEAINKLLEIDPEVKAIVYSGYSEDPVLANFQEYGFKGMMPKPFESRFLGSVLYEVLQGEDL